MTAVASASLRDRKIFALSPIIICFSHDQSKQHFLLTDVLWESEVKDPTFGITKLAAVSSMSAHLSSRPGHPIS